MYVAPFQSVPFSGLSGSYIPHFVSSMVMIIPFMLTVTWLSATDSAYSSGKIIIGWKSRLF